MIKGIFKKAFVGATNHTFLQLVRYTFVGGFAFIVDYCLLFILTEYGHFHYLLSASVSFIAGLLVNYLLSKRWVFNNASVNNRGLEFFIFSYLINQTHPATPAMISYL